MRAADPSGEVVESLAKLYQTIGNRYLKRLLIVKTGAAGDVLRTTVLIHFFPGWEIDWLVAPENKELLCNGRIDNILDRLDSLRATRAYDLVLSLEDDESYIREVLSRIRFERVFGSYVDGKGKLIYSEDSAPWFDLSLISKFGIEEANRRKLENRQSYQDIIVQSLGYSFSDEPYIMPQGLPPSILEGDIAIVTKAGQRWPIKNWPHFNSLSKDLSKAFKVNILPARKTLVEHLADVRGHRFVVCPDSLPMHIALGFHIPTVAIFTCTSPWEIHDYGILTKVISPRLEDFFYSREFHEDAISCIHYDDVLGLVVEKTKILGKQETTR